MSTITKLEQEARDAYEAAVAKMDEQDSRIQSLPDGIDESEVEFHRALFEELKKDVERAKDTWERQVAIADARRRIPRGETDDQQPAKDPPVPQEQRLPRGAKAGWEWQTKVELGKEPRTYTPQTARDGVSFWRDLARNHLGSDPQATERLFRHMREEQIERRDISTVVTAGGNFVPPQYLGELWAEFPRARRPFADAVTNLPLMATGMNLTVPRMTTGTSVSTIITENSTAVSETDIVEALLTVHVNTFAGQQDVSVQLLDRSDPSMDAIIFADLRRAYDSYLDTQMLSGTGANNQHLGIRAVTSINTVSYTATTPTAAGLFPKVYDAIQKVESVRLGPLADMIIMHPRRAAWLASNLSSTFPLFQQGQLYQGAGSQDNAMVENFAGLRVIRDANIATNYGTGTNEDEIYVVASEDLILYEGPLQARVLPDVGSGTLTVRLQLYGYSAFVSGRQPGGITKLSGTGLVSPTF